MGFLDAVVGGSETSSSIDPFQEEFLRSLWERGFQQFTANEQAQKVSGFGAAKGLTQQGQGFLGQLGNAGQGLEQFTQGGFADEQVESLTDILNRNLSFNLGNISQQSALGNTTGGGRQGLAQGTAIGDTQLALAAGSADIMQGNLALQQQAAFGQGQLQNQGALGGLTQLGGQFNLSQAGFNSAFQPMQNFQSILGNPVILGQGSQSNGIIPALTSGATSSPIPGFG